jgi:hypothetical protein
LVAARLSGRSRASEAEQPKDPPCPVSPRYLSLEDEPSEIAEKHISQHGWKLGKHAAKPAV